MYRAVFTAVFIAGSLCACSMPEEMRRIEKAKQASSQQAASYFPNLTGEQVFIRTCNTCHPGGREGMGPGLDNLEKDFPSDFLLKKLIRQGKGIMPAQKQINDAELDSLVAYLRQLSLKLNEK